MHSRVSRDTLPYCCQCFDIFLKGRDKSKDKLFDRVLPVRGVSMLPMSGCFGCFGLDCASAFWLPFAPLLHPCRCNTPVDITQVLAIKPFSRFCPCEPYLIGKYIIGLLCLTPCVGHMSNGFQPAVPCAISCPMHISSHKSTFRLPCVGYLFVSATSQASLCCMDLGRVLWVYAVGLCW